MRGVACSVSMLMRSTVVPEKGMYMAPLATAETWYPLTRGRGPQPGGCYARSVQRRTVRLRDSSVIDLLVAAERSSLPVTTITRGHGAR